MITITPKEHWYVPLRYTKSRPPIMRLSKLLNENQKKIEGFLSEENESELNKAIAKQFDLTDELFYILSRLLGTPSAEDMDRLRMMPGLND